MKTVYKYEVVLIDEPVVELPKGATVLSFGNQREGAFIWALVDPTVTLHEERRFRLAGTGHPIENANGLRFVGTAMFHGGALVFHLFEAAPAA